MTTIFPQADTIQTEQFDHFDFSLEQRLIQYIEIQQKKYDSLKFQFMQEQYENQILQEQILKRSQELNLRSQELDLRSQELDLRSQELEFSKVHNNVLVLKNRLLLSRIESLEQKEKEQQIVAKSYESTKALQKSVKELHDRLTTIMEEL